MYVQRHFPIRGALYWTRDIFLYTGLWACLLVVLHSYAGLDWIGLPPLIVSILGTAVSFYLGFKGNAAYDRLWEARKIWGGIVNSSRTWGAHVTGFVTGDDAAVVQEHQRRLVHRHVAWLSALRTQLRRLKTWEHVEEINHEVRKRRGTFDMGDGVLRERMEPFVDAAELDWLMARKNKATQVIQKQGQDLQALHKDGFINDFQHIELGELLEEFYTLQGKCERIKNFPLPRQYATANRWFVIGFIVLLPLGLLQTLHEMGEGYEWLVVPASMGLSWVFYLWDRVLDFSENPFEGLVNDIPMDALSRTIEIDLREMLGETDLPEPVAAVENVLL